MAPGSSACKEVLESQLAFADYDTAITKSEANSNSILKKSSPGLGSKHGINSKNGVHDLLECPVCKNLMYPPIHQVGWWAGVSKDVNHLPGLIIRVSLEHGRYVARSDIGAT